MQDAKPFTVLPAVAPSLTPASRTRPQSLVADTTPGHLSLGVRRARTPSSPLPAIIRQRAPCVPAYSLRKYPIKYALKYDPPLAVSPAKTPGKSFGMPRASCSANGGRPPSSQPAKRSRSPTRRQRDRDRSSPSGSRRSRRGDRRRTREGSFPCGPGQVWPSRRVSDRPDGTDGPPRCFPPDCRRSRLRSWPSIRSRGGPRRNADR